MKSLADRLNFSMKERGLNSNSLSKLVGITYPAMVKIAKGETLEPKKIVEIANALNVDVQWLKTGEGEIPDFANFPQEVTACDEDETVRIEQFNVVASCGAGKINDLVEVVSAIEYHESYFRHLFHGLNPNDIKIITTNGDSMSPTIESGEMLFVNTHVNRFESDGIYVFTYGDTLHIKRLQMAGDVLRVISDNAVYPIWEIKEENYDRLHIHARVLLGQSQQLKRFG